jgi:SAM-dependent methyltransferase
MEQVREIYGRLLHPGMAVLDLMSSGNSHLPEVLHDLAVNGLGLNAAQLARNQRLTDRVLHDLNRVPRLPLADATFDAVICTVSVEYLTRPIEVFAEVARVLRPGRLFVLTFPDRCFPPKGGRTGTELYPFERMSLALEYFRRAGALVDLNTDSARGWPRPSEDRYPHILAHADPRYAAWARRADATPPAG